MLPIDPTHLLALHALLQESSVTKAAERMGLSQSSMSHRLAELRDQLDDPLLVREGSRLVPTPRALSMTQPLNQAIERLKAALSAPSTFNPQKAEGVFELHLPDLLSPALPAVVRTIKSRAPRIELRIVNIDRELNERISRRTPSLALSPMQFVDQSMKCRRLFELRFSVVARCGHPAICGKLTTKKWLSYDHITVQLDHPAPNSITETLKRSGLERRIGLTVPTFLAGLLVVSRSDLLMNVPLPVGKEAVDALGLEVRPLPIRGPSVPFTMSWHARFHEDAMHSWMRDQVQGALDSLLDKGRRPA